MPGQSREDVDKLASRGVQQMREASPYKKEVVEKVCVWRCLKTQAYIYIHIHIQ